MPFEAPRTSRSTAQAPGDGPPLRWGQIAIVLVALAACGGAIAFLIDAEPADEASVALDQDGNPIGEREAYERDRDAARRAARPRDGLHGLEQAFEGAGPGFYGSGSVDADEAREYFDGTMKHLEVLAERRRRLRQDEWKDAYRLANNAFVALEVHLDAKSDSKQREELEAAHRRLKASLAALRVRGGKFRPR